MDVTNSDSKLSSLDHLRPQLRRESCISLDGPWDFAIDARAALSRPEEVVWNAVILVPFAPETVRSGIADTGFYCAVWYRRQFDRPVMKSGERLVLHFGAVDYSATIWVNGIKMFQHEGGYTPFSVEITAALREGGQQEIIVRAQDDPADLEKPRGKQDWKLEPHSIWYPRTTGIWQPVWMEVLPETFIESVTWTSSLAHWEIGLEMHAQGPSVDGSWLAVRMSARDQILVEDRYAIVNAAPERGPNRLGELHRRIALSDPGIDDFRNDLLWSPERPNIIDIELRLLDASGNTMDEAKSYTALRTIATQGDRFILNGRPLPLRLVLDQGYWQDTGLTAPN